MNCRYKMVATFAPMLRLLPPWWRVRAYARLVGSPFAQGGFDGRASSRRIEPHGFEMRLWLDDWLERMAWFLGIYYEIEVTRAIEFLVRPGDMFIDVGANLGFVTLLASSRVTACGNVIAVEPNPQLVERLRNVVIRNNIGNIRIVEGALGSIEGKAMLRDNGHAGRGSLVINQAAADAGAGWRVNVTTGASLLDDLDGETWCCVKIDVEGYEQHVLHGLSGFVRRSRTAFIIEITDLWLRRAGGSAEELFSMMRANGYQAYQPFVSCMSRFSLKPLSSPRQLSQFDAVFLRSTDGWLVR